MKTLQGIIRGNTIELAERLGMADGQQVLVHIDVVGPPAVSRRAESWGDGLRRCAGALAVEWAEEDVRILEAIHEERRDDLRQEVAE